MSEQPHGSAYGYAEHVRRRTPACDECRRAHADRARSYYNRRYLNRDQPLKVDATGTHRRLQALAAIGWSTGSMGERMGVTKTAIRQILARTQVYPATATRVAALYDALWDKPGPNPKAAAWAQRNGWPPPLAWDDDEIDDPAAEPAMPRQGHRGAPRDVRELDDRVMELTRAGLSAAEIALRLRTYKRHVQRIRSRHRDEEKAS